MLAFAYQFCYAERMEPAFSKLQLRHLRLIRDIAECGQLSLAASRMSISQPAASRSLAEIENNIGQPLFERSPKGMTLTPIGQVVLRHARALLAQFDQGASEVAAFHAGRAGRVRVGAVTGPAIGHIVPAVRELKRTAQAVEVSISAAPSGDLVDGLLAGEYDFVAARVPPGTDLSLLDMVQGQSEHVRYLVSSDHPLRGKAHLALRELSDFPWVIQAAGAPIREAVISAHVLAGTPPPSDVIDTASMLVTLSYLTQSHAVAPVAAEVADLVLRFGPQGFAELDVVGDYHISPYHLIRLRNRRLSPLAEHLMALVSRRLTSGTTAP